eukprot:gene5270-5505_t
MSAGAAAGSAASTMVASAWLSRPSGAGPAPGATLDVALENARLRAELASLLAQAAVKELAGVDQSSTSSSAAAVADSAALAAKDDLIASLEATCKSLAASMSSYEKRISELECQVAAKFSSCGSDAGTAAHQQQPQEPAVISSTAAGSQDVTAKQDATEAAEEQHQPRLEQSVVSVAALEPLPAESVADTVMSEGASASSSKQSTVTDAETSEAAVAASSSPLPAQLDAAGSPAVTLAEPVQQDAVGMLKLTGNTTSTSDSQGGWTAGPWMVLDLTLLGVVP